MAVPVKMVRMAVLIVLTALVVRPAHPHTRNITEVTTSNQDTAMTTHQKTSQSFPPDITASPIILNDDNTTVFLTTLDDQGTNNHTVVNDFTVEGVVNASENVSSIPEDQMSNVTVSDEMQFDTFPISDNSHKEPTIDHSTEIWKDFTDVPYDKTKEEYSSTFDSSTMFQSPESENTGHAVTESKLSEETKHYSTPIGEEFAKRKLFSVDLQLDRDDYLFSGEKYDSPCDQSPSESPILRRPRRNQRSKNSSKKTYQEDAVEMSTLKEEQSNGKSRINRRNTDQNPIQKITVDPDQMNIGLPDDDSEDEHSIAELINVAALDNLLNSASEPISESKTHSSDTHGHKQRKHHRYNIDSNMPKKGKVEVHFDDDDNYPNRLPQKTRFPLKADETSNYTPPTFDLVGNNKKRDWCYASQMNVTVEAPGCIPKTIKSKYCVGQCKSYFIPQEPVTMNVSIELPQSKPLEITMFQRVHASEASFRSCGSCQPLQFIWRHVALKCPEAINKVQYMRVMRIKKCRCVASSCN